MSDDLFDDEYDPLAPMLGGPAADLADDEPLASGEFAGGGGVVRLVFDEGRLTSVRVHPSWFDRLPAEQTLAQAFEEAFLLAALARPQQQAAPEGDREPTFDLPPFSEQAVEAYAAMLHDHAAHWREVVETEDESEPAEPVVGRQQGVMVALDPTGHPERVQFADEWLDDVQVGVICSCVMGAVNRAYAQHVPVVDERQVELDRLRREHAVLQTGFRRLINTVRRGS